MTVRELPVGSRFLLNKREYEVMRQGMFSCVVKILNPNPAPDDLFVRGEFSISTEALVDGVISLEKEG